MVDTRLTARRVCFFRGGAIRFAVRRPLVPFRVPRLRTAAAIPAPRAGTCENPLAHHYKSSKDCVSAVFPLQDWEDIVYLAVLNMVIETQGGKCEVSAFSLFVR